MNPIDLIILAVIVLVAGASVRHLWKMRHSGGCGCGCAGCTASCPKKR